MNQVETTAASMKTAHGIVLPPFCPRINLCQPINLCNL
jgi:hypothetical protein